MSYLGRTALNGLVCLTATATLVAGMPHFDCRCPSGQVKPFCLGLTAKTSGCCCGGSGCSSTEAGRCCSSRANKTPTAGRAVGTACCCGDRGLVLRERGARPGASLGSAGCVKSLADQIALALEGDKAKGKRHQLAAYSLPLVSTRTCSPQAAGPAHVSWQAHPATPPPDLITVLQRLLI